MASIWRHFRPKSAMFLRTLFFPRALPPVIPELARVTNYARLFTPGETKALAES